jgi:hypothetical protein
VPAVRVATIGRLLLIAIVGVAAIALTSALAAPAASDASRLAVRTGPGPKIKLTRAGREVDYLRPGRHAITIRDTSRSHNVVLTRWDPAYGGVRASRNVLTSFAFVGTKTVSVMLRPGRYSFSCRRHSSRESCYDCIDEGMVDLIRVE